MKVIFHNDFYEVYASEPAAAQGRMESIMEALGKRFDILQATPAEPDAIKAVHSEGHIDYVKRLGLYDISALSAGGAINAASIGMTEPAFAVIRPPGHHASYNDSWGFCYFNNMAVALTRLIKSGQIKTASMLDFDLHYGDGNVNILSENSNIYLCNPDSSNRKSYLNVVESFLNRHQVDIIGISAGFDNHEQDWGGLMKTSDYFDMGEMVKKAAKKMNSGYFGILEGGYNHDVLGQNVLALLEGMSE